MGVLSNRIHVAWALATGGRLGVGNDPRYNKTRCFETFPFPNATDAQQTRIRALAEQLDAHRKRQQALHPDLTLTGMYNVLEKLRLGETLTAKDKTIHEQGLVSVLAQLHDELDAAVFDAYGWNDLAPALVGKPGGTTPYPDKPAAQAEAEEELLSRLVALNAERAAEEARGLVRWLRPDFQNPGGAQTAQGEMDTGDETAVAAIPQKKRTWPKTIPEQVQALRGALGHGARSADRRTARPRFQSRANERRCRNCWRPWSPWGRFTATRKVAITLEVKFFGSSRNRVGKNWHCSVARPCNYRHKQHLLRHRNLA